MIRGIIFDMDGLMLDTEKLLMRFWIESAKEHGFEMTREHVLSIRSLAGKYAAPKLQGIFGKSFDYNSVRQRRIELMNAFIKKNGVEKKAGLDILLEYLKNNGYKIAVATATDKERAYMYLTSVGVWDYFDKFICNAMVKNGKPAPDIYIRACEELNLLPCECIALEDSPNGITSAYNAGCKPVMVPDLSQPDSETSKLLYKKIDTLDCLINVLEAENTEFNNNI